MANLNIPTHARARMITFVDVARPQPFITNTDAIWTNRTPVKPLALDVRHQLLKLQPASRLCDLLVAMVMRISCSAQTIMSWQ